jgi:hypothetical protein
MSSTPPRQIRKVAPSTPQTQTNYMFNKSGPPNVRKGRQEKVTVFPENHPLMRTELLISDPPRKEEAIKYNYESYGFNNSGLSEENQMLARMGAAAAEYTISENKKKNPHLYTRNNSNKFKTPPRKTSSRKNQRKSRKTRKNRK